MITISSAENALKSIYLGTIAELLNLKVNPLLTKIEQTQSDVWGKEIRKAIAIGVNGGIGAGDEAGELPRANNREYLQFVSTLKNLYGQIEISDKAIRASADGKGAFTDLLNFELQHLLDMSRFNLSRMLYGSGSGRVTSVTRVSDKVVTADVPYGIMKGMVIDIAGESADSAMLSTANRVVSVNNQTKEITLTDSVGEFTGKRDIYVSGSKGKEITGLSDIFGASELYGISRASHPELMPLTKSAAAPIDDIMIQEMADMMDSDRNSELDYISCSRDVKYAYQDYLSQYKRNIDIMELDGGFKSLSFNGIPVVGEKFMEDGTMYLINSKLLKMHQLCDWRFLETENGNILRQSEGKPTYTATLVKYCDIICDNPGGLAKITDIG